MPERIPSLGSVPPARAARTDSSRCGTLNEHAQTGISLPRGLPPLSPLVAPVTVPVDEDRQQKDEGCLRDPRPDVDVARQGHLCERQARQHSRVHTVGANQANGARRKGAPITSSLVR